MVSTEAINTESVTKKSINDWTFKELMALPVRDWQVADSSYDSVLIVSTRKKHDSGWAMMAIIGVRKGAPVEIAAQCCDDIEWKIQSPILYGNGKYSSGRTRMDCAIKSGAVHMWGSSRRGSFIVGCALSSITIEYKECPKLDL